MDLTTLLGLFLGIGTLIWAILGESDMNLFLDAPSILIVLGGTIAATLVAHPMEQLRLIIPLTRAALVKGEQTAEGVIPMLVHFAEKARREGLLAMEEDAATLDDPFLRKGIQLVVDGVDPEVVRNVLEIEIQFLEERNASGRRLFQSMGAYAPAFGMIGTLIGLIKMLADLTDPDGIGAGMAVALITTLYGALLANLVFLPMETKLRVRSEEEIFIKEVMVEGILSVQAGENPRIVEEKLRAFLPRTEATSEAQEGAEEGAAISDVG